MSKCTCPSTFTGNQCETAVPKCKDVQCQNGGTCKESKFKAFCECQAGFGGDFCEKSEFFEL